MPDLEFTDRYEALGIPYPDPTTMCKGHCEGTGVVPVYLHEGEPHTAPYHWAGALWEAGMLHAPGSAPAQPDPTSPLDLDAPPLPEQIRAIQGWCATCGHQIEWSEPDVLSRAKAYAAKLRDAKNRAADDLAERMRPVVEAARAMAYAVTEQETDSAHRRLLSVWTAYDESEPAAVDTYETQEGTNGR